MTLEQPLNELAQREEAKEEEEQLSISQLMARRERLEPTESIVLVVTIDSKGKAPETPSSKPKKRKLIKVSEGEPKKTKLMYSSMSVGGTASMFCDMLCFEILCNSLGPSTTG